MKKLKILFMGTPDFAACSLRALVENGEEVAGVITRVDKAKGRGMKVVFSDVKAYALEQNLPVYQPETLKDGALLPLLDEIKPDVIVVVAYGRILPSYILEYPPYGCINVHGSLLPAYRGAAPIQRAVLDGKAETGVTTMHMDVGMDTGDIIFTDKTPIGENETTGEVWDRLASMGGALLLKTLHALAEGTAPRIAQDSALATIAPKIEKEETKIDFSLDALTVHNTIRGMAPFPGAWASLSGIPTKLSDSSVEEGTFDGLPVGSIASLDNDGAVIVCGKGAVRVRSLKPEGSRLLSVRDMINGRKISPNDLFS